MPLNYRLSDPESVYVINNSDSELIFADVEFAPLLARIRGEIPAVKQVVIFGGEPLEGQISQDDFFGSDAEVDRDRAAAGTMIYTSGDGQSQGCGAPRHLVARTGRRVAEPDRLRPRRCLHHLWPALSQRSRGFAGIAHARFATWCCSTEFDPEDWLRLVDTYKASSTFSAPTPIRMVVNLPDEVKAKYDTSSMKIMIANAAPWPHPLKEAYIKDFPPESLWEVYGSTEMGVNTVLAPEDQMRKPGSCGKPAPFVEVALFDDDGNTIDEPNVPGELFVRASSVFDTYYKAEEKYAADDRDGWHTVGDIAYRDDEGYLFICDRKKDMIISGGMNIYPAEIEAALEKARRDLRGRRDRCRVRTMGRDRHGDRRAERAGARRQGHRRRGDRPLRPPTARQLQGAPDHRTDRRDPQDRLEQDPQARAA
ncbi:MAG: AMP-binding protein [Acidimicrobiales bacterium]